jgi:HEAT repeat protein
MWYFFSVHFRNFFIHCLAPSEQRVLQHCPLSELSTTPAKSPERPPRSRSTSSTPAVTPTTVNGHSHSHSSFDSLLRSSSSALHFDAADAGSDADDDLVSPPTISVSLFTPLLGLLLLDSHQEVATLARVALVRFFCRLHDRPVPTWDDEAPETSSSSSPAANGDQSYRTEDDERERLHRHACYEMGNASRDLIEERMLEDVVLGLARLDGGRDEVEWELGGVTDVNHVGHRLRRTASEGKPREADVEEDEDEDWSLGLGFEDKTPSWASDNFGAPLQSFFDTSRTENAPINEPSIESGSGLDSEVVQGRLVSLELIAGLAGEGCVDDKSRLRVLDEIQRLGTDRNPVIRTAALEALGAMALSGVKGDPVLWNMVEKLEKDPAPKVRRAAILVLPPLLEDAVVDIKSKMVKDALARLRTDESKDVQTALLEATGQMVHLFVNDPDLLPEDLLDFYLDQDDGRRVEGSLEPLHWRRPTSGGERALVCAFNMPAVALVLGEKRWKRISSFYARLASDLQPKVRRSLASSTHELARIIGSAQAGRDLVPSFAKLLADPGEEVKASAVDRFEAVIDALDDADAKRLMDALKGVWDEGNANWRVREAAARLLARTASRLGRETEWEDILEKAIKDETAIVRQVAVDAVCLFLSPCSRKKACRADVFIHERFRWHGMSQKAMMNRNGEQRRF